MNLDEIKKLVDPNLKNRLNVYLSDQETPIHLRKVALDLWHILVLSDCEELLFILENPKT